MKENDPNSSERIFEELEYFIDTSVKSMLNGYIPPKKYNDKQSENVKYQENIEVFDPYEVFNPFNNQ